MQLAVFMLAGAAAAAVTAQQPPAQAAQSVQQQFDAAEALDAGKDPAAALAAWDALERRTQKNKRSHAVMLVRKSAALARLGRLQGAAVAAHAGLADLPPGDATLTADRVRAYLTIGRGAELALDYAGAAQAFHQAEEIATTPSDKVAALFGQIATLTFTDSDAALAASGRADAVLAANTADPAVKASFASAKGILLMNRGDVAGARKLTAEAVRLRGGLTSRTDLEDVSARSDAALALLLGGNSDEARHYMAMTGAGRLTKGSFDPGAALQPPPCGGEAGLKPSDMAVIEFSVGDDGTILAARPIYSQGGAAVALEFARSAMNWTWSPENVKAMPAFFRYNARLEMRCDMAFERPSVIAPFVDAVEEWAQAKGGKVVPEPSGSDAAKLAAALAQADAAGAGSPASLPYLLRMIHSPALGREDSHVLAERGAVIAAAAAAPEPVRMPFELARRQLASADGGKAGPYRRAVEPMLASYRDPQVLAALRLMLADAGGSGTSQRGYLEAITRDDRLARNDPLKVGALIRIASLDQAKGDVAAARAAYDASGLAPNQCALLDRPPKLVAAGGTFPQEAVQWGFEGWTVVQYDVGANGNVLNQRVIASYPPFVFSKAGSDTMRGARFAKTFRPDGGLGCGAVTNRVRFAMP